MSELVSLIQLKELVHADTNVRERAGYDGDSIRRLATKIEAQGLVQYPVGHRETKKRVAIHAGGRRLAALQLLQSEGRLPAQLAAGIPIILRDDDRVSQLETSLSENFDREDLTPLEEFQAFGSLQCEGYDVTRIANRFGVTETLVKQRLALAAVHPTILDAYKADRISLASLQAYTIEPDAGMQLHVFKSLSERSHSSCIRQALTQGALRATCNLVQFVGIDAYEAAGGAVMRDLFDAGETVCTDVPLMTRLASDALQVMAEQVAEEGWKWVEIYPQISWDDMSQYAQEYPAPPLLSDADHAELDAINDRLNEIEAELEAYDEASSESPELADAEKRAALVLALCVAQQDRDAIMAARYTVDQIERCGAVITIINGGRIDIRRGRVRPEDCAPTAALSDPAGDSETADARSKAEVMSSALAQDLNLALTAALQHRLVDEHAVAFLVSTAFLVSMVFKKADTGALQPGPRLSHAASLAFEVQTQGVFDDTRDAWQATLDGESENTLTTLASWPSARVQALHSFCAAALYSRDSVPSRSHCTDQLGAHEQVRALLDFVPSAAFQVDQGFLRRLTKVQLLAVLQSIDPALVHTAAAPKAELVKSAVKLTAKTGWLPQSLKLDRCYGWLVDRSGAASNVSVVDPS